MQSQTPKKILGKDWEMVNFLFPYDGLGHPAFGGSYECLKMRMKTRFIIADYRRETGHKNIPFYVLFSRLANIEGQDEDEQKLLRDYVAERICEVYS